MADLPEITRRKDVSTTALVLANLTPLFGVLFLHWSVFSLLLLYWLENVTVGVVNVLRLQLAPPFRELLREETSPSIQAPHGEGLATLAARYRAGQRRALLAVESWMVKLGATLFFCVHWGMFTSGHGAILFQVFGGQEVGLFDVLPQALTTIQQTSLGFAALSM